MTPQFPALEGQVNRLDLHLIYSFGKTLAPLASLTPEVTMRDVLFPLLTARTILHTMGGANSPLLSAARRAVGNLIAEIDGLVPGPISEVLAMDMEKTVGWRAGQITRALSELESVLGNDMPGIAAYLVIKKGIYDTDDLITNAERQLNEETAQFLPRVACDDLQAAGKCLAYALPTACAFHLWRAVETVADFYYQALTGKTFKEAKITRTWFKYIEALEKAKADKAITGFLNLIRHKYRNPQTHPTTNVSPGMAKGLFSVAIGVIDQMLMEIGRLKEASAQATIPGVEPAPQLTSAAEQEEQPMPEEEQPSGESVA